MYIVANGSSCCFSNWIQGWFCHHGRLNAVSLETASRDTQTLNLSQNVSKFYARQVASDDRAAKPKFVALRWLTTVLMEYKSTIFNSFEKGSKLFFPSLFNACLSLTILCEIWTIKCQQMAKMSDRAPNERLGTSRLSHVFLKFYPYDPTSKFQE